MTAKRDLKRRVRQRQARTGESYVTARRRVLAARTAVGNARGEEEDGASDLEERKPREGEGQIEKVAPPHVAGDQDDDVASEFETTQPGLGNRPEWGPRAVFEAELARARARTAAETGEPSPTASATEAAEPPAPAPALVELEEITEEAAKLGFRCRITVYPSVLQSAELANVLHGLRDALVGAGGANAELFDVAFGLPSRPWVPLIARPYERPAIISFIVTGRRGPVAINCRLWYMAPTLILRLADEQALEFLGMARASLHLVDEPPRSVQPETHLERELISRLARLPRPLLPPLFVVDGERRHLVTRNPFVIGRARKTADLPIRDSGMSRKHAAVIFRNGAYYLKDLGSMNGIRFKGMLIDNKRIHEGDVFRLGEHELRFTYRAEGPRPTDS